jgi:peptide-methionine (S)-S-oxide reductase
MDRSGREPKSLDNQQSIILGGGCFWCLEAYFKLIKGINSVTSGYSGGKTKDPTYQQVNSCETGHAEVVKIEFDLSIISLDQILEIFWVMHDPTTLNRQGADIGPQYRSVVIVNNDEQFKQAQNAMAKMQEYWNDKIVTEVILNADFYPAEDYHQNYFANNQNAAYCQVVINPKLTKLKQKFAELLK